MKNIVLPYWVIANNQPKVLTPDIVEIILTAKFRMNSKLSLDGEIKIPQHFLTIMDVINEFVITYSNELANSYITRNVIYIVSEFLFNNREFIVEGFQQCKSKLLLYINSIPAAINMYHYFSDLTDFMNLCSMLIECGDFSDAKSLNIILNKLNQWYIHADETNFVLTDSMLYHNLIRVYPNANVPRIVNRYKLTGQF